jgi:hypothetical protein
MGTQIEVAAGEALLQGYTKNTLVGLSELIWNSLDADATDIDVTVQLNHLGAVPAGPRSSALPLMAGARCQPPARSAIERERGHALAQTGLLAHLPRAAHPLNSPHGTDDAVPRVLPSAPPYGDLARNLVSRLPSGEGAALPDESAGRGIRLRPARALRMRPLFSHRRESPKRCRHQSAPAPCRTSD